MPATLTPILDRSTLTFVKTPQEILDACGRRIAAIEDLLKRSPTPELRQSRYVQLRIFKAVRDHVEDVALDGDNLVPLSLADLVYFFGPHAVSESEE